MLAITGNAEGDEAGDNSEQEAPDENKDGGEGGAVKVQQWTTVARSDTSPLQAPTAEGDQPKGLIKTLSAHGIQACASGGWTANTPHHGQDLTESLIDQLATMTIDEHLAKEVNLLFRIPPSERHFDIDSRTKDIAPLVDAIVAEVGTNRGCQLLLDRVCALKGCSVKEAASRIAGPPINKAKVPKARHHPHFKPKG